MKKIITLIIILIAFRESATCQWQQLNIPSGGSLYYCLYAVNNTVYAGSYYDPGINVSYDNGTNWTNYSTGLSNSTPLAMIVKNNLVFISELYDTVFMSTDTGHTWVQSRTGLTTDYINSFAWINSYLFAGDENHGVFRSTDTGQTWTAVNTGITSLTVASIGASGNNLLAGTYSGGFYLSTDSGSHWRQKNNGLLNLDVLSFASSGNKIFAATSGGVYLTTDTGSTWNRVSNGLTYSPALAYVVTNGSLTFTGDRQNGVHVSYDDGAHWASINSNLPDSGVWSIFLSPTSLFIGTDNYGVFKLDLSTLSSGNDLNVLDNSVNIFPNSGNGTFNISVSDLKKNTHMEIMNSIGEIIFTSEITQPVSTFNFNFAPGIYFARINNTEDQVVKKLIIN